MPSVMLASAGYEDEDIAKIKNYKEILSEHIAELNTFSDDVLVELGYSESQIEDIRTFDGSETQMARISATVTINTHPVDFAYDGDYTRGRFVYNWKWNGVPEFKLRDMVAVSWNDWAVEAETSYVCYSRSDTGVAAMSSTATFTQDGNGTTGATHSFLMRDDSNSLYYASNGNGSFTIRSDVHAKKDFYYYIAYGHSQLVASISFSVSTGGGDASISFSLGTVIVSSKKGELIL